MRLLKFSAEAAVDELVASGAEIGLQVAVIGSRARFRRTRLIQGDTRDG